MADLTGLSEGPDFSFEGFTQGEGFDYLRFDFCEGFWGIVLRS